MGWEGAFRVKSLLFALAVRGTLAATAGESVVVTPAAYGFKPQGDPGGNRQALQKALDGGKRTVKIEKGEYWIDGTVFIDSDTTIECEKGVVLRKAAVYSQMLVNRGAYAYGSNENIVIKDLEIKCGPFDSTMPEDSNAPGLRGQIAFVRCKNVKLLGFRCHEYGIVGSNQYCVQFVGFDGVLVEDFEIVGGKDALHFDYGRNFVVRHGCFAADDDGVALNAGDWPGGVTPLIGSIENGLVEDVWDLPGHNCNFSRVISGAWVDWQPGMKLQRNDLVRVGKNIYCVWPMPRKSVPDVPYEKGVEYVSNTRPTHSHGVWKSPEGINFQYMQNDGNVRADIKNVTFRNCRMCTKGGIACRWEMCDWARLIHPLLEERDFPIIDIKVENCSHTYPGPLVSGGANCRIELSNCRTSLGDRYPLVELHGPNEKVEQAYTPCFEIRVDGGRWMRFDRPFKIFLPDAIERRPRNGIGNFIRKVRDGKDVNVAYFGGSAAWADGWQTLCRKWLSERYPGVGINWIDAAIAGGNSGVGARRFAKDVLLGKPDLVFVDFAADDLGLAPEAIQENYDGFLQQLWNERPNSDVVIVHAVTRETIGSYCNGLEPPTVGAVELLARHYGVPTIDFGVRVARAVRDGENAELMWRDGVYPSDRGQELNLRTIESGWTMLENCAPSDHAKLLYRPFFSMRLANLRMAPAE